MMDDNPFAGLGCVFVLVVLLLGAVVLAIWLPGQIAEIKAADAQRIEARAELVEVRAAAEHQRAVDAESRYMLHTATLAAFLGTRSALDQICAGAAIAAVVVCCVALSYWVLKRLDW